MTLIMDDYKDYYREHDEPDRKRVKFLTKDVALETGSYRSVTEPANEHSMGTRTAGTPGTHPDTNEVGSFQSHMEAIVGAVSPSLAAQLMEKSAGDVEIAVNLFLDHNSREAEGTNALITEDSMAHSEVSAKSIDVPVSSEPANVEPITEDWDSRLIGSFQAEVWATRSGRVVQYQEKLSIERSPVAAASKSLPSSNRRPKEDFIVRAINSKGFDIARLSENDARIVALLIDTGICKFSATCIFADDWVRTGDYMIIQIDCYMLRSAFHGGVQFSDAALRALGRKPVKETPLSHFDNSKENQHEKIMRLRKAALNGLFVKLNMIPDASESEFSKAAERMGSQVPRESDDEEEEELNQNQLDSLYKNSESADAHLPELEPASTFKFTLRQYQKKGLNWMVRRENEGEDEETTTKMHPLWQAIDWPEHHGSFYANLYSGELSLEYPRQKKTVQGGILADEMGLGKTISTMALIHTAPCTTSTANVTLVVAPMSLLAQWESEAYASSHEHTVQVLVYYGAECSQLTSFVESPGDAHRIIITSYGTLLSEHSAFLKNTRAHGSDPKLWNSGDPQTVMGLYYLQFHRLVLDEAHTIKNRNTKTSRACYDLKANHRWALTGTPIVNRLEDLYSLIKFLGVEPWNNFAFWKAFITTPFQSKGYVQALSVVQTVMEPLLLRRTKNMKQPDGTPLVQLPPKTISIQRIKFSEDEQALYSWIFARISSSVQRKLEQGSAMKSFTTILAQIMRLRQTCCHPSLVWKPRVDADDLESEAKASESDDPLNIYDIQDHDLRSIIDKFNSAGQEESNPGSNIETYGVEVMKSIIEGTQSECPICTTEPIPQHQQAVTSCWHMACLECLLEHINFQKKKGEIPRCHICRANISAESLFQVATDGGITTLTRYKPGNQRQSAKIKALVEQLQDLRLTGTKSVVFSQFTSFLDIIQTELNRQGFDTLRFDGTLSQKSRAEVISQFENDSKKTILLISLKAGGVGLNLICARQAFMMDPWWSFAVEAQAIDRIHRMGQTSEVKVVRFIVEGSLEERMLKIQERKKFLASSLGMSEEEKRAQRLEDIKLLFEE
jgi:DNA repair protein RAD5